MRCFFAVGTIVVWVASAVVSRAEDASTVRWPSQARRATISHPFHNSEIIIGVSSRTAGAVDSLTWSGHAFINAADHGRELQSAVSFDGYGECFNPTEAGSGADGAGALSSSRLDRLEVGEDWLLTKSVMAFWVAPHQVSPGCPRGPGPYRSRRSDYALTKRISIGAHGIANAIAYTATYSIPRTHTAATYEAATAYLPPEFSRFWTYDPAHRKLSPLSAGPGEQSLPVILATQDGSHAMGVYSPALPQINFGNRGYGRWNFASLPGPGNATVKWNCVFRDMNVVPGEHTFTCYVVVGSIADVQSGIDSLFSATKNERNKNTASVSEEQTSVKLYVGTQADCNSGIVTVDPQFAGCSTAPIGATLAIRSSPDDPPVFASAEGGTRTGVVTSDSDYLNVPTRGIGFLRAAGTQGTPIYVGTQGGCNAGMASTNPSHLNCSSVKIGLTVK